MRIIKGHSRYKRKTVNPTPMVLRTVHWAPAVWKHLLPISIFSYAALCHYIKPMWMLCDTVLLPLTSSERGPNSLTLIMKQVRTCLWSPHQDGNNEAAAARWHEKTDRQAGRPKQTGKQTDKQGWGAMPLSAMTRVSTSPPRHTEKPDWAGRSGAAEFETTEYRHSASRSPQTHRLWWLETWLPSPGRQTKGWGWRGLSNTSSTDKP